LSWSKVLHLRGNELSRSKRRINTWLRKFFFHLKDRWKKECGSSSRSTGAVNFEVEGGVFHYFGWRSMST
jgi:hypothetical protein